MTPILTSASTFKGFNSSVGKTSKWFTNNRTVDLTEYVYGKSENVLTKTAKGAFNIYKWYRRIASIKRNIKRLKNIVKKMPKIVKFITKISKFLFKLIKPLVKLGIKIFLTPAKLIVKAIFKGGAKVFKFSTEVISDIIKKIIPKINSFVKTIIKNVTKFINKKIINPIKHKINKWIKRIYKIIKPYLDTFWKLMKSGFGKVKNLVVGAGKAFFTNTKLGQKLVKHGKTVIGFAKSSISFFKTGSSEVVSKVIGMGKEAKDIAVVTKEGTVAGGKSAIDFVKNTKRRWKIGLKLFERAHPKTFKTVKAIFKVAKVFFNTLKVMFMILKSIFTNFRLIKNIVKGVASTIGGLFALPTLGIGLLVSVILGLLIEGIFFIPEILTHKLFSLSWWLEIGKYLLAVAGWVWPGLALAQLIAGIGVIFTKWLVNQVATWFKWLMNGKDDKIFEEAGKFKEAGMDDAIFTSTTAQRIDNINDLQKHVIVQEILNAKEYASKFNNTAVEIIQLMTAKQIKRTQSISSLNTIITI